MILKAYKRNLISSIAMILLGLLFAIDTFRSDHFILIYDGLKLLCGILWLIFGSWGMATPFATINNKELTLRISIAKTKRFDLLQAKVDFDTVHDVISLSSVNDNYKLKLKYLNSTVREDFINDLRGIVKQ